MALSKTRLLNLHQPRKMIKFSLKVIKKVKFVETSFFSSIISVANANAGDC